MHALILNNLYSRPRHTVEIYIYIYIYIHISPPPSINTPHYSLKPQPHVLTHPGILYPY